MCFMPQHEQAREFITGQFEKFIAKEGQRLIGWRDVPTTQDGLGKAVLASMPMIRQCFIARGSGSMPAASRSTARVVGIRLKMVL